MAALAGANLIHDVGYLESGLTGSLESIVLGAEQIRWVKRFLSGLEVSDETLGLRAIGEVGPVGHFLEHGHTLKHLRRTVREPYVTDRGKYERWVSEGGRDYATRAREDAAELVQSHQPQAIDESVKARLVELREAM